MRRGGRASAGGRLKQQVLLLLLLIVVVVCWLACLPVASLVAEELPMAGAGSRGAAGKPPLPADHKEEAEEEEVSVRPSPVIKLELRFPSNAQPVGPPRISHHPAYPAALARRHSQPPAGSGTSRSSSSGSPVAAAEQVAAALGKTQEKWPPYQSEQSTTSNGQSESQPNQQSGIKSKSEARSEQPVAADFNSHIATNKSAARLECDSGQMLLSLNFSQPFRGVVYPDHSRLSPCRFFGDGHLNYQLRIPLQGCGSRQSSQRVFVNNVVVRFHRTLELEEDEVKTLICRYPAPPELPERLSAATSPNQLQQQQQQQQLEQEEGQFELLEPATKRRPAAAIQTLSDNLQVGPNLLQQHHLLQTVAQHQGRPALYGAAGNRSADLQQEAPPNRPTQWWQNQSSTSGTKLPGSSSNSLLAALDSLTSVELLFLTSSLMFLVLLLLALALGYCCYRRQAARESARLTSAILSRGHRSAGFGSPTVGANLAGLRCGPLNSGHRQRLLGGYSAAPTAARWVLPQQQVSRHLPSASSPESDQSGHRNLLGGGGGGGGGGGHHNAAYMGSQSYLAQQHFPSASPLPAKKVRGGKSALGLRSAALYGLPACQLAVGAHHKAPLFRGPPPERAKSMVHPAAANYRRRQRRAGQRRPTGSGSETDPEELANAKQPRLVLKSIEDSFITNLTEIHSQEYMKRDSMQPLHISKWRSLAKQPEPPTGQADLDSGQDQYQSSAHTNLRSLTEMDVVFSQAVPAFSESAANLLTTAPPVAGQHSPTSPTGQLEPPLSTLSQTATLEPAETHSPDLILSPEYEHPAATPKLQLKSPSSPHNSVSYV